jgi:hypothetical protein
MNSVLGAPPSVRQAQYEEEQEPVAVAATVNREPDLPSFKSEDDDDALSYFARLAEED